MLETRIPDVDVEELMERVRQEVERNARRSSSIVSEEIFSFSEELAAGPDPEVIAVKDRYTVEEFLGYSNTDFVANVYRALLKREADAGGYSSFLDRLERGELTRIDVLGNIRFSPEGRKKNVRIDGLMLPYIVRRFFRSARQLYRLPGIGYLLRLIVCLVKLPILFRNVTNISHNLRNVRAVLEDKLDNERYISGLRKVSLAFNELEERTRSRFEKSDRKLDDVLRQLIERYQSDFDEFLQRLEKHQQEHHAAMQEMLTNMFDNKVSQFTRWFEQRRLNQEDINQRISQVVTMQRKLLQMEKTLAAFRQPEQQAGQAGMEPVSSIAPPIPVDTLYLSLEDRFRGEREDIKQRLEVYLPYVKKVMEKIPEGTVLDVGCGRGEWLELLRDNNIPAVGVDLNQTMVEDCKELGLEAVCQDLFSYIQTLPDSSLAVVSGFHVLEHFPFEQLVQLLDESLRVLQDDGLIIFETPNPENLLTGACNFYVDPTHRNPLPPLLLEFLFQVRGIRKVKILRLHPNESVQLEQEVVQNLLFGPQDYAVLGWK